MRILLYLLLLCMPVGIHAQLTELKPGMKISKSVKVRKALFTLNADTSLSKPVIVISGDNIVVDFNDAILKGSNDKQLPDEFYGVAVLVKGGKNITIKNLKAKGYKVALMATDVEGLVIENCNFSYNYRQHLNSTQEKEDISDWMSYHQNEKDEWLRYGAAIYLRNCNKSRIYKNVVTGGQCALMMTQCNGGLIYNNNFSFNSAIGIGMYRSSKNQILHNKLDWNVRGHSEGVYNRGQDSAGILVFEQCNDNVFANNSATHSGDGFFLWAGQNTMDTGIGGCNNNLIVDNDFSHAPTNGIEVTFSKNEITGNRLEECDHGIWGGYSYNTLIFANAFSRNRIAIAIEHGQDNEIFANRFSRNKESIRLWARREQPKDWGYAQKRDTRSRDYSIIANSVDGDSIVFNISNTEHLRLEGNEKKGARMIYKIDSFTAAGMDTTNESIAMDIAMKPREIPTVPDPLNAFLPISHPRGRKHIRITEWGPYDFRSPLIWRTNPMDTSGMLRFELLGPKGAWKVTGSKGVEGISKSAGVFPDNITARKVPGHNSDFYIELEYTGAQVTTQFGEVVPAGRPHRFAFRDARIPLQWQVKWFNFDSASNPLVSQANLKALEEGVPFLASRVRDLNYAWWGGIGLAPGRKDHTRFLTTADTEAELEPGEYELSVTWDDAVRVMLDGELIINEWNPAIYKFDASPNKRVRLKLGGKHRLRVQHVELGGFATISVKLKKV